jgi:hypothetical protein
MQKFKLKTNKLVAMCVAVAMIVSTSITAFAADTLKTGTYKVDSTLSCYVNAMGGVEFADGYGMLKSSTVQVAEDGTTDVTLELGVTSGMSIYGVACSSFIGTDEAPGIYDAEGKVQNAKAYTVSKETAANKNGQVNYIDSITFTVNQSQSEYTLWLYLDSNVMGCQLGDGSGSGSSNTPGVSTAHTAKLTIDWDSAELIKTADSTSYQKSYVVYGVNEGFEVEIPAQIVVDSSTKVGKYNVTAKSFFLSENAYVTVVAAANGTLSNGKDTISFTNTLATGNLLATGDTLAGQINITSAPATPGVYTGTTDFTINYFAG